MPLSLSSLPPVDSIRSIPFRQKTFLPVHFHLIQKTERVTDPKTGEEKWRRTRSKNDIVREMIASAINRHIPFRYVLNDIWFASAEKTN